MAGLTPTQRTIKYLRDQGIECGVVERWIPIKNHPGGGVRRDLFNIIDIVALGEHGIIGIQSTGQAFAKHDRTILSEPMALKWIEKGGHLILIGWTKKKRKLDKGWSKALYWTPRIKHYHTKDFQ